MTKFIRAILKKENIKTDLTLDEIITIVDNTCTQYFSWLSKELSETGFVDRDEVEEKVNELIPS